MVLIRVSLVGCSTSKCLTVLTLLLSDAGWPIPDNSVSCQNADSELVSQVVGGLRSGGAQGDREAGAHGVLTRVDSVLHRL